MLAVNITNGKLVWHTPFVAANTTLKVPLPNATAFDWDTAWGSHLVTVKLDNGTAKKL
jgi:hypothetical protein